MTGARLRSLAATAVVLGAALSGGACHDKSLGPNVPASVSIAAGDSQTVLVGDRASQPLVAVVRNSDGAPLPNVTVNWSVASGGGSLSAVTSTTDADGKAQVVYLSGAIVDTTTVAATANGRRAVFTVLLAADTVAILSAYGGNGGAALVGFPLTLTARATDRFGNPVKDVVVDWSAPAGTLESTTATTDSTGQAKTVFTVGTTPGDYTVTAASRFNTVTFTVTAIQSP